MDLRLYSPWPELRQHAQSIDFDTPDTHEYAHIPPLIILLRALDRFKENNDGKLPSTYSEKTAFKKLIASMKRGGNYADEENFEDAISMVTKAVKPTIIPSNIKTLFEDPSCDSVTSSVCAKTDSAYTVAAERCLRPQSPPFWILLRALREFVNDPETNNGEPLLPLVGNVPDMKATSLGFASLVSLYRSKAKKDMADYKRHLADVLAHIGMVNDGTYISEEMIGVFVKNAAFVEVVKGRRMRDEYERPQTKSIGELL